MCRIQECLEEYRKYIELHAKDGWPAEKLAIEEVMMMIRLSVPVLEGDEVSVYLFINSLEYRCEGRVGVESFKARFELLRKLYP